MLSRNTCKMILLVVALAVGSAFAQMYHEQSSATSKASFTSRSFTIDGKPVWLFAGQIEYWRIPKELWRDRLMRVKRAGYNAVSTYIPWCLHEPIQGQFHYEDNLDLDTWLTKVKEAGLYAIIRVGPYICAEVDFGGFTPWLVDFPGIKIRGTDTTYLKCVDKYYESVFPIITKHQITNGGPVVVVQIENEHYPTNTPYQTHLVSKAQSLGMVVPYIWSMVNNGTTYDPGMFQDFSTKGLMTEQWVGWISRYGASGNNDVLNYNRQTWRMVAEGTGGTSHYMVIGGTNFGYTASLDQRVTTYDYGSPIGELGQIRPMYYSCKQAGWLVKTFNPLVTTSTSGSTEVGTMPTGLTCYAQSGTAGKSAWVLNTTLSTKTFQLNWTKKGVTLPTVGSWSLDSTMFAHFLADVPVTTNATLDYSATGVLGMKKLGTKNYLVLYGTPGNTAGDIAFVYKTAPTTAPASPWTWDATAMRASLHFTYPTTDTVNEVVLDDGAGQTINLLIMSNATSNKTWIIDSCIVSGAEYVNENNNLLFAPAGGRAFLFSAGPMQTVTQGATTAQSAVSLSSGWSWVAATENSPTYNDSSWAQSAAAQDMTYYKYPNGYGWYRTTYNAATAGTATLAIPTVQGAIDVFVNGTWVGGKASQTITLNQGANSIAIFVYTAERDKMYNTFNYAVSDKIRTGIYGNITINGTAIGPWKFRGGWEGVDEQPMMGTISSASWSSLMAKSWSTATPTADKVARLWRRDFTYTAPTNGVQTWTLNATVDSATTGVVWLNGHCLGRQIVNQSPLFIPECWLSANNTLIVLTRQGTAPKSYSLQPVEFRSIATTPFTGTRQANSIAAAAPRNNLTASVVISGNRFAIPHQFEGKTGSVAIYDLRGQLVGKADLKGGKLVGMRQQVSLPNGLFIARLAK